MGNLSISTLVKNPSNFFRTDDVSKYSDPDLFSAPNSRSKEPLFFLTIDKFALSKVTEDTLNLPEIKSTRENFVVNELKDKIGSLSGIDKSTLLIFISGKNPSSNDK